MNNPDIRRYERALGCSIQGVRRRRKVKEAFRCSLLPLLEEETSPSYADLEDAFGPPEQMAQDLMGTIPDLPEVLSTRKKVGFAIVFCLVAIVVGMGVYCWWNGPEEDIMILEDINVKRDIQSYMSCMNEEFSDSDYSWEQRGTQTDYLILLKNTNQVETTIYVSYNKHRPAHVFVVPAGEQRVFWVKDARPTEHVVSFTTADGSMGGRIKVFVPKAT